jgi:acetyl esterase
MPVDPQLQPILEHLLKLPRFETLSVEQARALATEYNAAGRLPPLAVASVVNRVIPGPGGELPIRIYTPDGTGPFPLMMYFRGSGIRYVQSRHARPGMPQSLVVPEPGMLLG